MAQTTTETDDDDLDPQDGQDDEQGQQPEPQSGLTAIQRGAVELPADVDYEIEEVDDQGHPLSTRDAVEARLTEDSQDDALIQQPQQTKQQPRLSARAQRRAKQREGRDRTQAELTATKAELQAIRQQMATVQGGMQQIAPQITELQQERIAGEGRRLEEALARNNREFEEAEQKIAQAMSDSDNAAFLKAMRDRDEIALTRFQLRAAKQQLETFVAQQRRAGPGGDGVRPTVEQRGPAPQPQSEQQEFSPRAKVYADEFRQDFPWYQNPRSERDRYDSKMLEMLDAEVLQAGYDPGSESYWDELEDRLRAALPHRFTNGSTPSQQPRSTGSQPQRNVTQPQQRRAPPVATGEQRSQTAKNVIRITPQRKESLIQEGILDVSGSKILDRAKWDRRLKYYDEFDRDNSAAR